MQQKRRPLCSLLERVPTEIGGPLATASWDLIPYDFKIHRPDSGYDLSGKYYESFKRLTVFDAWAMGLLDTDPGCGPSLDEPWA